MIKPYSRTETELHFELGEEIGFEGKNSRVFIAHDPQLGADLVIKQIDKANLSNADEYFAESTLLYANTHPNVVPIHYACQDEDCIYLAMPYFQNRSLKSKMDERFLSVREIIILATQFLSGLHHIHSKGLIHFDIKPDNILITDRHEGVLSDFGLAKQVARNGFAGQDRNYLKMIPPEGFRTDQHTFRFDIYQAGLTIYRMCIGDDAFYAQFNAFITAGIFDRNGFRHAVVNGQFPDKSVFPEHIPAALINTVKECLQIDPSNRCGSAIKVVNKLANIDDKTLDWQYEIDANGRKWSKLIDGRAIKLSVDNDNQSLAIRLNDDGPDRRILKFCLEKINRSQIKQFLRSY